MGIIRRAGFKPWPKLFHNGRSTRETELAESFPLHIVTAWTGDSELVSQKHYLQISDEHFARAAQNPAQQSSANGRDALQSQSDGVSQIVVFHSAADVRKSLQSKGMRLEGLEPPTLSSVG